MPSRTVLISISVEGIDSFNFLESKPNLFAKSLSPLSWVVSKYSSLEIIKALGCIPNIRDLSKTSGGNAVNLPSFILSTTAKSSAFVIPLPFSNIPLRFLYSIQYS